MIDEIAYNEQKKSVKCLLHTKCMVVLHVYCVD